MFERPIARKTFPDSELLLQALEEQAQAYKPVPGESLADRHQRAERLQYLNDWIKPFSSTIYSGTDEALTASTSAELEAPHSNYDLELALAVQKHAFELGRQNPNDIASQHKLTVANDMVRNAIALLTEMQAQQNGEQS